MSTVIQATPKYTDEWISEREGTYFDTDHYSTIIQTDTDVYKPDGSILLRFRKGVISPELCNNATDGLREISMKQHDNRGAPAGLLDWKKMPNYVKGWYNTKKFRTYYYRRSNGQASKHDISNLSPSNVIGYFDRKDRNDPKGLPCRLTAFSAQKVEEWKLCIPLVQRISNLFQELIPDAYARQRERALLSPDFIIQDTCFSTITVNYSWRTAMHRDKGDYLDGFGNIIVCEDPENPNTYTGCCTGFPQYGVCVDVRQGDFLAMDVHEWHCNTEFIPDGEELSFMGLREKDFRNNWHLNRMSLVCYLRNNMAKCSERIAKCS